MKPMMNEKLDSLTTYGTGVVGITFGLAEITTGLQLISLVLGVCILVVKLAVEIKKYNNT